MCTALTLHTGDRYFGRNLDLEYRYEESVTVTPRQYPFFFRQAKAMPTHYALIGMAYVAGGYPLYYDGVNEQGLAIAGLHFPGNAVYGVSCPGKDNISPFELIPWLLGQCATLEEARRKLERLNLIAEPFSPQLPLTPMHWLIADKTSAITVEPMAEGLKIYDNPVGVLTNNPPFAFMLPYLTTFRELTAAPSANRLSDKVQLSAYCRGFGAHGLPGDYSSPSRFVRAAFAKLNSVCDTGEAESVSQFFHLLSAVEMPRGCVRLEDGGCDITVYSSCCNQDKVIYYYVTYDTRQITAVDMHRENLEGSVLIRYPLRKEPCIFSQNGESYPASVGH